MKSACSPSDDAEEQTLFQEMKGVMEKEVAELPATATRRGFLQEIAVVAASAPVVLLALGEEASACYLCDESYGCQAGCLLCDANSGCQANCLITNICGACDIGCDAVARGGCGPSLVP